MSDNVAYTAGTGTTIATDDVAGVHYQRVKINDGTADSTNALVVDSSGRAKVLVDSGPAAARTTDTIAAALATDAIMNSTTALAPKYAKVSVSSSGANTVIALVSAKKLRVLGAFLVCTSAVAVNFQSHTTTTTATGAMPFAANGGIVIPFSPVGWFETVAGEALDINLGGAVAVNGMITYVEV